jgi:hypothetical protein
MNTTNSTTRSHFLLHWVDDYTEVPSVGLEWYNRLGLLAKLQLEANMNTAVLLVHVHYAAHRNLLLRCISSYNEACIAR